MPLYNNSVIYKLIHQTDFDNQNIYIGSTTNFRGRKIEHKYRVNNGHNAMVYQFIRDNGGWEEWLMIPIETYQCECKKDLEIRERYYIESMKPKLNRYIPTRTDAEYYADNRQKISETRKQIRNSRVKCPICGLELNNSSLKNHQKKKH